VDSAGGPHGLQLGFERLEIEPTLEAFEAELEPVGAAG